MSMIIYTLQIVGKILSIVLPLLISVAYFTLAERKIMGAMQRRKGPNVVGTFGLLQPLADGFKLLIKETVIPSNANTVVFILWIAETQNCGSAITTSGSTVLWSCFFK